LNKFAIDETTGQVALLNNNFSVSFFDLKTQGQIFTGKNQFSRLKILDITLIHQLIILMVENVFQELIEIQIYHQTQNSKLEKTIPTSSKYQPGTIFKV
jgi:hypothetical protein